uniref:Ion_trans_2 domain-containing protein n=2 Tax=Macrostomum lignano TaxID=282301 RepID=A0A1I8IPD0_9PLAT
MLYSLIGIPLCIVMFQSIGERLNALITFLLRSLKHLFRCKNGEVSQMNLIVVSMNICTLVLAAGAALFSHYEKWSYLDSVYYCFITLTTVGFGDMVAMQKSDPIKTDPDYVLFSLLFIMAGLTVVSSAMNLLVLRFLTMNTEDAAAVSGLAAGLLLLEGIIEAEAKSCCPPDEACSELALLQGTRLHQNCSSRTSTTPLPGHRAKSSTYFFLSIRLFAEATTPY